MIVPTLSLSLLGVYLHRHDGHSWIDGHIGQTVPKDSEAVGLQLGSIVGHGPARRGAMTPAQRQKHCYTVLWFQGLKHEPWLLK